MALNGEYIEAPEYIGILTAASILKDPVVQAFVRQVREREGIVAPISQDELAYNREQHDPLAFFHEALPIADEHLGREIFGEGDPLGPVDGQPAQVAEIPDLPDLEDPEAVMAAALQGPMAALMEVFIGVFRAEEAVPAAARVISRYIVAGYLEPPEPIPSTSVTIGKLCEKDGGPFLLAIIAPWANMDEDTQKVKAVHRDQYAKGKRVRVPDTAIETLWLRFCLQDMGRDPDSETGYTAAAELSFEVWPLTKPKHPKGSQRYEAAVRRWADKIRKRSRQWEKWRDVMFA